MASKPQIPSPPVAGPDLAFVDEVVKRIGGGHEQAIPILQALQGHYRYLPDAALRRVCELTGIPPADRRRIFEPFRKSARDAAESAPGVGLGLALGRRTARSLGGDLRLLEVDGGACFALSLPTG